MTAGWFRLILHRADVAVSDALHGQVTYARRVPMRAGTARGRGVRLPEAAPSAGTQGGAS